MLPTRSDRLVVFGILNVTPDSFSDGGKYGGVDDAVAHGVQMREEGADVIDVGGESTRPGAARVSAEVEASRVLPVIEALVARQVPVSIDTTRAAVAAAAVAAGASIVNDVSGGLADPAMADVVRDTGVGWILMHWRGHSDRMQSLAVYDDVVAEVCSELDDRVGAALQAGVRRDQLAIDPGIGFAKNAHHNWALLAALDRFAALDLPVLIGASRKSFLGPSLADPAGVPRPAAERDDATTAITALCAKAGVWGVRVHAVGPSVDAARTVAAVQAARR